MKSLLYKQMAKKFPGDTDLGKYFLAEIECIELVINKLDATVRKEMSVEEGKEILRALVTAFAEIHAEIEMPILAKFPELRKESMKDRNQGEDAR